MPSPFMTSEELAEILGRLDRGEQSVHHGATRSISREPIRELIDDLKALLFPHCATAGQHPGSPAHQAAQEVFGGLVRIIHQVSLHNCDESPTCVEQAHSGALAREFFEALPTIQEEALTDAQAAFEGDPAARGLVEIISTYPGFYATLAYRLAHRLHQQGIPLLPRMMTEIAHSDTGIDIHPAAHIGLYFFIDHGTGVVIGETTQIGDRVTLYQGVTLGALNFPHDQEGRIIRGAKRHPTIEDDVVIYSEATILGGDTVIGHHSVIGGNVWLTESVPPFSKVTTKSTIALRTRKDPVT